jgi:hypothetical protein
MDERVIKLAKLDGFRHVRSPVHENWDEFVRGVEGRGEEKRAYEFLPKYLESYDVIILLVAKVCGLQPATLTHNPNNDNPKWIRFKEELLQSFGVNEDKWLAVLMQNGFNLSPERLAEVLLRIV